MRRLHSHTAVHATPKRHGRAPPPPPQMSGRTRQAAQASRGSSGGTVPDASAPRSLGTLGQSVTHLWSRAKQHAARTVSADAFLQSEKLQQQATLDVEQRIFTQLHAASSHRRQALLASLQAPGCSAWLTTLPTQRCYSMADESVRLGVRKRLGLLPFECLSTVRCSCRARTPFSSDPDHFHSCDYFKRTLLTQRHNNLAHTAGGHRRAGPSQRQIQPARGPAAAAT